MRVLGLFILLLLVVAACSAPPEDVAKAEVGEEQGEEIVLDGESIPIDPARSSFTFKGYGPGKSHPGTFEEMSGSIVVESGRVVAAEGVIQAASVKSDSERLDEHLRSDDFFDVANHPTIEFASSSITETEMIGQLTFLGLTKEITIPVTRVDGSLSADFLLDTEQFGMSYTGVNPEVRIQFEIRG